MKQKRTSKRNSRSKTIIRLGSTLSSFALLLVGLSLVSLACSSGSSSPTEPPAEPIDFNATTSDDGTFGSSSGAEVDGQVIGVDTGSQSMSLITGVRVIVDSNTLWDPLGDLVSYGQVVGAFNAGSNVRVEADGSFLESGAVLAATIKAETDEDGPNDDGPDGPDDPDDDSDFDDDVDSDLDDDIDSDLDDDVDSDDSDSGDDSDDSDSAESDNSGQG